MTEAEFQKKVLIRLRRMGGLLWCFKVNDRYQVGIPDIIGCLNGKFFALECKKDAGKMTPIQIVTLDAIAKSGGFAAEIKPMNFEYVINTLEGWAE